MPDGGDFSDFTSITLAGLMGDAPGEQLNFGASDGVRGLFQEAEVLVGRDVMTGDEFPLFGRKWFDFIIEGGDSQGVRGLVIELDRDSDELPQLLSLVEEVRGAHEYPI